MGKATSKYARFSLMLVAIVVAAPDRCRSGEDGLGRWYPPGAGRKIGKYNWPYSYYTAAVPQRPGHGYFPTYWRDWHENAEAIFSEPEHTFLPKKEKRKQKAVETLPEPKEEMGEEQEEAPPPPSEPEIPPSEAPELPSDNLELPSGQTPQTPSGPATEQGQEPSQAGEESAPQAPPSAPPEMNAPDSAPELPMPNLEGESETELPGGVTTPEPSATEPEKENPKESKGAGESDGPSLYRQEKRERALARQASAVAPRRKKSNKETTLQALGNAFGVASDAPGESRQIGNQLETQKPPANERHSAPTSDGASSTGQPWKPIRMVAQAASSWRLSAANAQHGKDVAQVGYSEPVAKSTVPRRASESEQIEKPRAQTTSHNNMPQPRVRLNPLRGRPTAEESAATSIGGVHDNPLR